MFRVEGLGVRVWGLRGHVLRSRGGLESEVDGGPRRAWGVEVMVMGLFSRTGLGLLGPRRACGVQVRELRSRSGYGFESRQARCDVL